MNKKCKKKHKTPKIKKIKKQINIKKNKNKQ